VSETDPYALAGAAAEALRKRFGIEGIDVAVVLGSGWAGAAEGLGGAVDACPLADLPGFSAPIVAGHGGELRLVRTPAGRRAALFTGRTHFYEGRGVNAPQRPPAPPPSC
jgi:purine-nucleoside phosphorylase